MHASRGEPEKVLMFARFFRGSFDGLAAEVEVAAFLHFSSAEGIHRPEGRAGFLDELEEARIPSKRIGGIGGQGSGTKAR